MHLHTGILQRTADGIDNRHRRIESRQDRRTDTTHILKVLRFILTVVTYQLEQLTCSIEIRLVALRPARLILYLITRIENKLQTTETAESLQQITILFTNLLTACGSKSHAKRSNIIRQLLSLIIRHNDISLNIYFNITIFQTIYT